MLKFEVNKKAIQFTEMFRWTKMGVSIGICLGNNQENFQLRFTTSENIAN